METIVLHTPGPWRRQGYSVNAGGVTVRQSIRPSAQSASVQEALHEQRIANARLIAAAPEMLQLLREFIDGCDTTDKGVYQGLVDDGRELIARIEHSTN